MDTWEARSRGGRWWPPDRVGSESARARSDEFSSAAFLPCLLVVALANCYWEGRKGLAPARLVLLCLSAIPGSVTLGAGEMRVPHSIPHGMEVAQGSGISFVRLRSVARHQPTWCSCHLIYLYFLLFFSKKITI